MRRTKAVLAAVCLLPVLSLAGCGNDAGDYEERVSERLRQANIENVDVDWNEQRGVLRLSGQVANAGEATRAEAIAARTIGAAGRVLNELEVSREPIGTTGPGEPAEPGTAAPPPQ
jgi:osmotically-inducible protein OsmY